MGFLDKWRKKRERERLDQLTEGKASGQERVQVKVAENTEEEKKEKTGAAAKAARKSRSAAAYRTLISPIISEKAAIAESRGVYTFVVDGRASKLLIKEAVAATYNVTPQKVRVINLEGKRLRFGRHWGKRKDWKKAIVTLPKGQSIRLHEGV